MKYTNKNYIEFLSSFNFNQSQIDFIVKQAEFYYSICKEDYFNYDCYERDLWYVFNQSGLFESNDENNISDIDIWDTSDTRFYITEIKDCFLNQSAN